MKSFQILLCILVPSLVHSRLGGNTRGVQSHENIKINQVNNRNLKHSSKHNKKSHDKEQREKIREKSDKKDSKINSSSSSENNTEKTHRSGKKGSRGEQKNDKEQQPGQGMGKPTTKKNKGSTPEGGNMNGLPEMQPGSPVASPPTSAPTQAAVPTSTVVPTIPLENQDDRITCISVIDENVPENIDNNGIWNDFRNSFPDRPFCLLQPNLPNYGPRNDRLVRPTAFTTDGKTQFHNVSRDDGDDQLASDWYELCDLEGSKKRGLTRVSLFIDNSGSMSTETVQASFEFFQEQLAANGFEIIMGEQNDIEDWISPCLTASTVDSEVPTSTPTAMLGLQTPPTSLPSTSDLLPEGATAQPTVSSSANPTITNSNVPSVSSNGASSTPSVDSEVPTSTPTAMLGLQTPPTSLPSTSDLLPEGATAQPTVSSSANPTITNSNVPSVSSNGASSTPSVNPISGSPSITPSTLPSSGPTNQPPGLPSMYPSVVQSTYPSLSPSILLEAAPEPTETLSSSAPSLAASISPSMASSQPSLRPSNVPTKASGSPSNSPSLSPTVDLINQNELLSCISVIDENLPFTDNDNDGLWNQLREEYPMRPFCLLQPNRPIGPPNNRLYRPASFSSDDNTIFRNVTRDNGEGYLATDWYEYCNMDESKEQGLTRVALFIDVSGSMTLDSVKASYELFQERLRANGFEVIMGVQNLQEDWISPCLTASTVGGAVSSEGPSEVPSLAPSAPPSDVIGLPEEPTTSPTELDSSSPSNSMIPSWNPSAHPSSELSSPPSVSLEPTVPPTEITSSAPSISLIPSSIPSAPPSKELSSHPSVSFSPSSAPTTYPTIDLAGQDDLITCISVIDENRPLFVNHDALWEELREEYPLRPFCLLQPSTSKDDSSMYLPESFSSDNYTIFENVTRDNGEEELASDWYETCNLAQANKAGLTRVALFVDGSGSMTLDTVKASLSLFRKKLEENGFEVVVGDQTMGEDWITPCLTATTHMSSVPSKQPSAIPSIAPSSYSSLTPSSWPSSRPSMAPSGFDAPDQWETVAQELSGTTVGDQFGRAVAFSNDGQVAAVGAPGTNSGTGSVSVFKLKDGKWSGHGQVLSGENVGEAFGASVDLSKDGSLLAVGVPFNTDIGTDAGKLILYRLVENTWEQEGSFSGPFERGNCGYDVALSDDGSTVVAGCPSFDQSRPGEVHVLSYNIGGQAWEEVGQTLEGSVGGGLYGFSVDVSANGNTILIGAPGSTTTGFSSGRVFTFRNKESVWKPMGQPFDGDTNGHFAGYAVSLSADGNIAAFGLPGFSTSESGTSAGAIRTKRYSEPTGKWADHTADLFGSGPDYRVGQSFALSADGEFISYFAGPYFENGLEQGGRVQVSALRSLKWIAYGPAISIPSVGNFAVDTTASGDMVLVGYQANDLTGMVSAYKATSIQPPTPSPTLSTQQQDELLTCISVLDENTPFQKDSIDELWTDLRTIYPDRAFCLLQPNQVGSLWTIPSNSQLYRPPAFTSDGNTIFRNVTRDNGFEGRRADWYNMCNLEAAKEKGVNKVALFIDDSGSMSLNTVGSSLKLLEEQLELNGFEIIRGDQNDVEDYITPCLTATAIPP